MRTRWLGGLLTISLIALLSACGGASPAGVVDVGDGGQDIEIVADGETVKVDGGGDVKVPDDFPSDIPLPDGDPATAAKIGSGGEQAWSLAYPSSDEAIFDAYVAELAAAPGAVVGMSLNQAGMRTETFTIGSHDVAVQLIPDLTMALIVTQTS